MLVRIGARLMRTLQKQTHHQRPGWARSSTPNHHLTQGVIFGIILYGLSIDSLSYNFYGALAHLVERFHGMEEARSSSLLCSTMKK